MDYENITPEQLMEILYSANGQMNSQGNEEEMYNLIAPQKHAPALDNKYPENTLTPEEMNQLLLSIL